MVKKEIKIEMIKDFDENKPDQSAILTQEMADIINIRKNTLRVDSGIFTVFSQFPLSGYSDSSKKAKAYMRSIPGNDWDNQFKEKSKNKELEIEIIFFLAQDYERRDVDNMIKIITDALIGLWYEDDGQIKRIIAEKIRVKDMDKSVNPRLYEQMYVSARILS